MHACDVWQEPILWQPVSAGAHSKLSRPRGLLLFYLQHQLCHLEEWEKYTHSEKKINSDVFFGEDLCVEGHTKWKCNILVAIILKLVHDCHTSLCIKCHCDSRWVSSISDTCSGTDLQKWSDNNSLMNL